MGKLGENVELGSADQVDFDSVVRRVLGDLSNSPRKIRTSGSRNVLSVDGDEVRRGWDVNGCVGGI